MHFQPDYSLVFHSVGKYISTTRIEANDAVSRPATIDYRLPTIASRLLPAASRLLPRTFDLQLLTFNFDWLPMVRGSNHLL
jgi:hypothetical protein